MYRKNFKSTGLNAYILTVFIYFFFVFLFEKLRYFQSGFFFWHRDFVLFTISFDIGTFFRYQCKRRLILNKQWAPLLISNDILKANF